jgi:hypothetical protein
MLQCGTHGIPAWEPVVRNNLKAMQCNSKPLIGAYDLSALTRRQAAIHSIQPNTGVSDYFEQCDWSKLKQSTDQIQAVKFFLLPVEYK